MSLITPKEFQKYQLDIQKQYKLLGLESKFKDDPKFKTPEFISNLDKYRLFRRYFDDQKQRTIAPAIVPATAPAARFRIVKPSPL